MEKSMTSDVQPIDKSKEIRNLFDGHLTKESYHVWTKSFVTADVYSVFSDVSFGTIEWLKDLGRPSTLTMAEGFKVEFWMYQDVGYWTPEGWRSVWLHTPMPVSTWDGQSDEKLFRVNYMVTGLAIGKIYLSSVRFANGRAAWPSPSSRFLSITPQPFFFEKSKDMLLTKYVVDSGFQSQTLGW
jgi:hypothetical protein